MDSSDSGRGSLKNQTPFNEPVSREESGQKLLRFLERRLGLPQALLHRWVRTGQIRLNGGRCKPFDKVSAGDIVRLPPFAGTLANETELAGAECSADKGQLIAAPQDYAERLAEAGLPLLGAKNGIWALNKPAGLPVQSGTGQPDSIAARLHEAWKDCFYHPAPAHRLDRDTSGVLLVGGDFESLRNLQEAFRSGGLHKEYLVWVEGNWPCEQPVLLKDWLRKEKVDGVAKMCLREEGLPFAREALCLVRPLSREVDRSLLQVRLLTGRTHQVRVQLSGVGHPAIGDGKYGRGGTDLKLHSLRIGFPDGDEFSCPPPWQGPYASALPPSLLPEHANNAGWEKILPRFCEIVTARPENSKK